MKVKYYEEFAGKHDIVYEEDAEQYVLDRLQIKLTPNNTDGTYDEEQKDFLKTLVEWYFSGDWITYWEDVQ